VPVLPEDISAHSFRRRWRGYDREQVDGLLGRVSAGYGGAIERLAESAEDGARARAERAELDRRLGALSESARQASEQARREADADAAAIRARAERAAELILAQAEEAAAACTRRAEALRASAQADADAARQRLEDADRRARQLEDAARDRWDAVRAETEARFQQLQATERRFADRVRQVESALNGLRSQVALLDQVHQAEQVLAAVRVDTQAGRWSLEDAESANGHQR
jgi:DivIVA domain-containing protein